ncbi:uncharacterized protein LOC122454964 [Cervus canadensis]|uniref:uncharacterized protein LOC122454964 n=1 Tax=Cervus canadensis TaxID=1574408 RepID=UPI001C9E1E4B|nr:uncharacterized protein LOC122454964 [Cervus canadensis]
MCAKDRLLSRPSRAFARAPRWGRSGRSGSAENHNAVLKCQGECIPSGLLNQGVFLDAGVFLDQGVPILGPSLRLPAGSQSLPAPFPASCSGSIQTSLGLAHCGACNWGNSSPPRPPRRRCPPEERPPPRPTPERGGRATGVEPTARHLRAARLSLRARWAARAACIRAANRQRSPARCARPRAGARAGPASRVGPAEARADPPAVGGAAAARVRTCPAAEARRRRRQRGPGKAAERRPAPRREPRSAWGRRPRAPFRGGMAPKLLLLLCLLSGLHARTRKVEEDEYEDSSSNQKWVLAPKSQDTDVTLILNKLLREYDKKLRPDIGTCDPLTPSPVSCVGPIPASLPAFVVSSMAYAPHLTARLDQVFLL